MENSRKKYIWQQRRKVYGDQSVMMKKLLLVFMLLTPAIAQTGPSGYVSPMAATALSPSGIWLYILLDGNGNLELSSSQATQNQGGPSGYVQPVAVVGLSPSGTWLYLQTDANGNLKTSGSGSGISACAATPPTSAAANTTCVGTNGNLYTCGSTPCTSTGNFVVSPGTGSSQIYFFGGAFVNGGSAITSGVVSIPGPAAAANCTILAWDISINATDSGTATVKFVRVASGTASPGTGNSINTSGVQLGSGTHVHSTTLTDFTSTAVTAGDVIAAYLTNVTGTITGLSATISCQ